MLQGAEASASDHRSASHCQGRISRSSRSPAAAAISGDSFDQYDACVGNRQSRLISVPVRRHSLRIAPNPQRGESLREEDTEPSRPQNPIRHGRSEKVSNCAVPREVGGSGSRTRTRISKPSRGQFGPAVLNHIGVPCDRGSRIEEPLETCGRSNK